MQLRRRRLLLLMVLPLALGAGVAVAAHGSAGKRANGVIHACASKRGGHLRVVAAAGLCRKGEQALSWNVHGPAGPRTADSEHEIERGGRTGGDAVGGEGRERVRLEEPHQEPNGKVGGQG